MCTSCQLLAITPSIADTGDTVLLEGTFGPTATVMFPGAVAQPAMVLGAHRASVIVPSGATAGSLTVVTGGATVGPVAFRRAAFQLGVAQFEPYDQAAVGREALQLLTARISPSATAIGNHVYVIGGLDSNSNGILTTESAVINGDGTLGAFATAAGNALATSRGGHAAVAIGNQLYVVGGFGVGAALETLESAEVSTDGTLGAFAPVASTLNDGRIEVTTAIIGNYLYVIGGGALGGPDPLDGQATIERALIDSQGGIGAFEIVSSTLATPRFGHGSVVCGNWLYVLGGNSGGESFLSSIERAPIAADGSLGPFVAAGSLTSQRWNASVFVLGDSVYVAGGTSTTNLMQGSVETAAIGADGTLGPFSVLPNVTLIDPRSNAAGVIIGNEIYVIAGDDNQGPTNAVESSSIDISGGLAAPAVITDTLAAPLSGGAAVASGATLYVLGGVNSIGPLTVESTAIAPDGSLGKFEPVAGVTFETPRSALGAAVIGNRMYAIGGESATGATANIESSTIGADGTLSTTFSTTTAALVTPRANLTTPVIGTNLYAIGGGNGTTVALMSIEAAPINPDGTLGAFAAVTTLATARAAHCNVRIGNALYVIGGNNATTSALGTIERAPIVGGVLGAFSTASGVALVTPRYGHTCAVIGNSVYVAGGADASQASLKSVERAQINADGTLGSFAVVSAVALTNAREALSSAVIGDQLYVFGGTDGAFTSSIEQANLQ